MSAPNLLLQIACVVVSAVLRVDVAAAEADRLGEALADLRALQRDHQRREHDPRLPPRAPLRAEVRRPRGWQQHGVLPEHQLQQVSVPTFEKIQILYGRMVKGKRRDRV